MEASKFRAAQEPLKERYRNDAKAALLTLKAKGTADDSTVTCKIETGRGPAVAGIHLKCGGSGLELCSGDLLLEALIACAGVSLKAAASVLDITVKSATISAEGDVDLRGTLGITDGVPVGFKEIRLHFDVETDAPQSDLAQLLEVTERYCVISDDPEQPEHKGPNERGSRLTGASAHVHVRSCLPARFSRSSGETARIHI